MENTHIQYQEYRVGERREERVHPPNFLAVCGVKVDEDVVLEYTCMGYDSSYCYALKSSSRIQVLGVGPLVHFL